MSLHSFAFRKQKDIKYHRVEFWYRVRGHENEQNILGYFSYLGKMQMEQNEQENVQRSQRAYKDYQRTLSPMVWAM
jgi:hypothetical protein